MATNYKLRQAAIDDLREIGQHTLENFGEAQRDKYLNDLNERFELLGILHERMVPEQNVE